MRLSSSTTVPLNAPDGTMHFVALRHLAALCVLFSHSFALSGQLPFDLLTVLPQLVGIAPWGVTVFFVISGYLIAQSWSRAPKLLPFLKKRGLRIYPGLLGCLVFAIVLGAFFTKHPLADYLAHADLHRYAWDNIRLQNHITLVDVFQGNPTAGVVTGSIWTLPLEMTAYLCVALLGCLGLVVAPWTAVIVWLMVMVGVACGGQHVNIFGAQIWVDAMPHYYTVFCMGALHHQLERWCGIGISRLSGSSALLSSLVAALLLLIMPGWGTDLLINIFYAFNMSVLVLALARVAHIYLAPWWPERRLSADFSYGLYLYSFPIQQAVVAVSPGINGWMVLCWSLLLSAVAAALSWYVIERPALVFASR